MVGTESSAPMSRESWEASRASQDALCRGRKHWRSATAIRRSIRERLSVVWQRKLRPESLGTVRRIGHAVGISQIRDSAVDPRQMLRSRGRGYPRSLDTDVLELRSEADKRHVTGPVEPRDDRRSLE